MRDIPPSVSILADNERAELSARWRKGAVALALLVLPVSAWAGLFGEPTLVAPSGATAICVSDLNKDGKPDVVSVSVAGVLSWSPGLANGTFGPAQTIATGLSGASSVAIGVLNRDGRADVVVAGGSKIQWFANLGGGSFGAAQVVSNSTNGTCRLFVADIDRDGKPDIVSATAGDGAVNWFGNNGDGTFTNHAIGNFGPGAVSIYVADVDVDGAPDIVCASAVGSIAWFRGNGSGSFGSAQTIASGFTGASSVYVSDLNRNGKPDVLVCGGNKVAWYSGLAGGGFGTEQVVSAAVNSAMSTFAADVNGDGLMDVVCASAGDNSISFFSNTGAGTFGSRQIIANNVSGPTAALPADLDQDGDLDLLVSSASNVVWYSNRTVHRAAKFSKRTALSTNVVSYNSVTLADLDGDGLADAVYSLYFVNKIAWAHSNGDGTFGPEQIIDSLADSPYSITSADLNGDGRVDVVAVNWGTHQVIWYENQGGGSFVKHIIASGTSIVYFPSSVVVCDLDGDGKPDVVSASWLDNKIAWYRNLGGGSFGPQQVISTSAKSPWSVSCADLNGDGKPDIVSASINDQKVAWRANNGDGTFGAEQIIASGFLGVRSVFAADVDNDGLVDVVAASAQADKIVLYRNLGNGSFGPAQTISVSQLGGANSVFVADVNGDGLPDVLATAQPNLNSVAWFQNAGGGSFGQPQMLASTTARAGIDIFSICAGDFAGDGTMGILTGTPTENSISAYWNAGGAFTLGTTSTSVGAVIEGQVKDVFRVDLTHGGRSGDDDVVLKKLTLLFTNEFGVALTNTEASNLVRSVSIWAHTNASDSSAFDAAKDWRLFKNASPSFVNGKLVIDLGNVDPNDFRAAFGVPRSFFVVVELQPDASSRSPNKFQVINVTDQSGSALGSDTQGDALPAELTSSVSTPLLTISANPPPSTSGLADITFTATSAGAVIPLFPSFDDDTKSLLAYTISGNTNPNLFDFAGIDPVSGSLVLNYRAGIKGDSQLTITATDSGGKTVTASFHVTAKVTTTFGDWLANQYGSLTAGTPSDLASYAFALTPPGAKSASIRSENGVLVFSHRKPKYATDLHYDYEITRDLIHWTPAAIGADYFPYDSDNGDGTLSTNCVLRVKSNAAFMRASAKIVTPAAIPPVVTGSSSAPSGSALNHAPTTTGIADVTILDGSAKRTVPLFTAFSDWEDSPQQMTYTVARTLPDLFDSVSIDGSNGLLDLKCKAGSVGSSVLTVTARDTGGKTVSTSFTVNIAKIQTFTDWSNLYSDSLPNGQTQRVMDYALAINPKDSGSFGIMPVLKRENGSFVFSHLRPAFANDLTYHYQLSSDLVHWVEAVNGVHYFDFSQNLGDGTKRVNLLLLVDWPTAFVRARVDLVH